MVREQVVIKNPTVRRFQSLFLRKKKKQKKQKKQRNRRKFHMVREQVVIKNPTGLHLRPAGLFCKTAIQFECKITNRL